MKFFREFGFQGLRLLFAMFLAVVVLPIALIHDLIEYPAVRARARRLRRSHPALYREFFPEDKK